MPCYDGRDNPNARAAVRAEGNLAVTEQRLRKIEAMLCGVLSAAKATDTLDRIMAAYSPSTSGVEVSDVEQWFAKHQRQDGIPKKVA